MTDRIVPESENHALAIGRFWINRDPIDLLKELELMISFNGAGKASIVLSDYNRTRIRECIAFHEGQEN